MSWRNKETRTRSKRGYQTTGPRDDSTQARNLSNGRKLGKKRISHIKKKCYGTASGSLVSRTRLFGQRCRVQYDAEHEVSCE
ncbi:hypothetical protein X797_002005 [Metarhizium robertsii]|uniref:Uncharacterized protein n=1 Tax=Metarhizium robertsii TaxID=568076 RepID=A0A0A1V420_9HYPO|nr:hypothetical protein X797_002005 [Metarhizium robertsii]